MRTHRMSLAHAEINTTRLLEAIVDAAEGFELIEIEGDAAFLARPADARDDRATATALVRAIRAMHEGFHRERRFVVTNLCPCDACAEASDMKLKFVSHIGEVATQTVRDRRKLIGIDVILVHRLLKNPVEAPEYVLFSEELHKAGGDTFGPVEELPQDIEGIGLVLTYVGDVESVAGEMPPLPEPGRLERFGRTLDIAGRGVPYMLGLRRTRHSAARA